jgi:hypothetical protein
MAVLLRVLFLVLVMVAPVRAQEVDTNTPSGSARIVETARGTKVLMVGKQRVELPDDPFLAFIVGRRGNLLLVAYSQGGNACPAFYVWVHTGRGNVRSTESFGTCSDLITITNDSETVNVTMPSFEPGKGDVSFVYDGKNAIREVQHALAASGMGPDDGWDFWAGRHPYSLVTAGELQGRLVALLGPAVLVEAQRLLVVANNMARDGDWVAGTGCQAHMCDVNVGAVAVNVADGRFLLALRKGSDPVRLWGDARGALPGAVLEVLVGP